LLGTKGLFSASGRTTPNMPLDFVRFYNKLANIFSCVTC
jgi:hypothetical protein